MQVGPGSISAGVYSYNTLPLAGAKLFENTTDITSYSYDSSKKEFVTYDTPEIVSMKTKYVIKGELGGSMFWEVSVIHLTAKAFIFTSMLSYPQIRLGTILWSRLRREYMVVSIRRKQV